MDYTPNQRAYIDSVDGQAHMSAVEMIGKLDAANAALLAVMRDVLLAVEWSFVVDTTDGPVMACPTCFGWKMREGHAAGCRLAAVLAQASATV